MKKKIKDLIPYLLVIAVIVGIIVFSIVDTFVYHKKSKTALNWCLWEISMHEGFEDFSYIYEKVDNADESKYDIYCYYIITFDDEKKTEWFCYIEAYHKRLVEKAFNSKLYRPEEVIAIDCDIAIQTLYNGEVEVDE